MASNNVEHREFLLACAVWQDALLQNYRTLHTTIQGFLIAAGAAVLAVQLTGAIQDQNSRPLTNAVFNVLFTALLILLFWLQRKTSNELKGVVESRSLDVDFWHERVILSENALGPPQRTFTHFKMWQQAKRASVDHLLQRFLPDAGISESDVERLLDKGVSHTRRVLDVNLFQRLQLLWAAIVVASAGVTAWFFALWWLARIA